MIVVNKQRCKQRQCTTQSLKVIKNTVRAGLSSVLFARKFFGEEEFSNQALGGITLKNLTPKSKEAQMLNNLMEQGVFDALQKGYLSGITFAVHNDQKDIIESYQFNLSDFSAVIETKTKTDSRLASNKAFTQNETKKIETEVKNLLSKLVSLTNGLPPLPSKRHYSILLVYNDKAPQGYQPNAFCEYKSSHKKNFEGSPSVHELERVNAGNHMFNVRVEAPSKNPSQEKIVESHETRKSSLPSRRIGKGRAATKIQNEFKQENEIGSDGTAMESTMIKPENLAQIKKRILVSAENMCQQISYVSTSVIASYLGINNERLNRAVLSHLQKKHFIDVRSTRKKGYKSLVYDFEKTIKTN